MFLLLFKSNYWNPIYLVWIPAVIIWLIILLILDIQILNLITKICLYYNIGKTLKRNNWVIII